MQFASEFVPGATSGNTTEMDIEAPPELVWKALQALQFDDLRVTKLLIGIRSLPGVALGRGPVRRRRGGTRTSPLLEAITSSRFIILHSEPDRILTLGIVGQFWRLTGGNDAAVKDPATFVEFDEPGFVKSAIDFVLVPNGSGTRLTTNTCNRATDESTARLFRNYWRVIGLGSKLIRLDMLRAVRRRAESIIETS